MLSDIFISRPILASVCSLEPGSYTFTATSIETAAQGGPGTKLPGKGQIVVK